MKELLIIGARGFGREIFAAAQESIGYGTEFTIKGFLDDNSHALDTTPGYPTIVDSVEHYQPTDNDVFVCALGNPEWQKHYADIVLGKGGQFINLIHPTAIIGQNSTMGIGCIILRDVGISCDISMGDFVTCQSRAIMGHDVKIGSFCHIGSYSFMGGYVQVGDLTTVHPGAIILPHVKIGNHCTVGAGSVVIRKVKEGDTVFGNPAKRL